MGAAFKSAFGEIAVPIRPIGHHPSKLMANHLNIVSLGTCLPFWVSGAKWLLFNCRSLWLFVWEIDGLLTLAETDKCWPHVQLCSVFLKLFTFRIIFHRLPQDIIYIFLSRIGIWCRKKRKSMLGWGERRMTLFENIRVNLKLIQLIHSQKFIILTLLKKIFFFFFY